jgi:TrpR-related protein YerC/YecD
MVKEDSMSVNKKLVTPAMDRLVKGFLSLENEKEAYEFLQDLCTIAEMHDMSQRFEVAFMLNEGEKYEDIVRSTGASTATISRVKRSLQFGADGYKRVLAHLKEEEKK